MLVFQPNLTDLQIQKDLFQCQYLVLLSHHIDSQKRFHTIPKQELID